MRFNTAIARLTELVTHTARISAAKGMVAPFAPHIAEELWARLDRDRSLTYAAFPEADPAFLAEQTIKLPVQINGKTRFTIEVPANSSEEEIERIVNSHSNFVRHTDAMTVRRLVIVPG